MHLIYFDSETTGLDPFSHDMWEVAWAVDDGPIHSHLVSHDLGTADPEALKIGGYAERCPHPVEYANYVRVPGNDETLDRLRAELEHATLVGCCPAFDASFLRERLGCAPWAYRMLDLESYARPFIGGRKVPGANAIYEALVEYGVRVPRPDHTAAGDVLFTRAALRALERIYLERIYGEWRGQ